MAKLMQSSFYDFGTGWLDAVPVKSRTNAETLRAFREVIGDLKEVNSFSFDTEREYAPPAVQEMYCDKAREFVSTCRNVGIKVSHSTPGVPRTNAMAEAKVKLVLQGARVALRQAGLEAKFWPYAVRHFCMAANLTIEKGESAFKKRFETDCFGGQIIPFGCLVDYFPTPSRRDLRKASTDGVRLGVGEEDASAAISSSEEEIESEVELDVIKMTELLESGMDEDEAIRFFAEIEGRPPKCHGTSLPAESSDDNGKEDWFASDEFDPNDLEDYVDQGHASEDEVPDITLDGSGKVQAYQPRGKFCPTSRPGVFLGYHCEVGSEWKGDYVVADLEDFKQNINKPSVQQVKRIFLAPSEKYTFPLLPIYEKRTRSLCLDDPVMLDSDTRVESVEREDQNEVFDFNEGRVAGTSDEPESKDAVNQVEASDGAKVDYCNFNAPRVFSSANVLHPLIVAGKSLKSKPKTGLWPTSSYVVCQLAALTSAFTFSPTPANLLGLVDLDQSCLRTACATKTQAPTWIELGGLESSGKILMLQVFRLTLSRNFFPTSCLSQHQRAKDLYCFLSSNILVNGLQSELATP